MVYLILFLVSAVSIIFLSKIAKISKIPVVLWLIFLGIILGSFGFYDFFGVLDNLNGNVSELTILSGWAVIVLFLMSGLGLDIPSIKKSGKNAVALSVLPVYIEGLIMGVITYIIFIILPIQNFKFGLIYFMMIMSIFAMAAPAIIIPLCFKGKAKDSKSKIYDEMIVASVLDNFSPFPLLITYVIIGLALANGNAISAGGLSISIILAMVSLVIAYALGHILGLIFSFILKFEKLPIPLISLFHIILTLILITSLGSLGASYGIAVGFGSGVGFNIGLKDNPNRAKLLSSVQKIYGLFLMPLIFIYVGTKIRVDLLLNPLLIVAVVIITIIAIYIKGFVSSKYLLSQGYSKDDAKLSANLFAAKGVILINISLVLAPGFQSAGLEDVIQLMYLFAAIATLVSVPYSIISSEKILNRK